MFEVGKEYKRSTEIHGVYNGQSQGGISTPAKHPFVFIFTSGAGEKHGYKDEFINGLFHYTGEGQVGDMTMTKGNKAILEHRQNGKQIHVFEYTRKAHVRYLGSAECLGYQNQISPDNDGNPRKAFVFQLDIDSRPASTYPLSISPNRDIQERKTEKPNKLDTLRKAALAVAPKNTTPKEKIRIAHTRAEAIKKYILARANGICEGCEKPAPFKTSNGPYLECHHLFRLADGGPDHPENVIALCPNCHREAHYSVNAFELNQKFVLKIYNKEKFCE